MRLADFACESGKCDRKGSRIVYEDLPIASTRCPVCGSKKLRRLYNRIAVRTTPAKPSFPDMRHTSSSKAARIDVIAEPAISQADANAARMKEARLKFPNARMVSPKNLKLAIGGIMQELGAQGQAPIRMDPTDADKARQGAELPGVVGELAERRQGRVPTKIQSRDQEFKVVRNADGTVGIEKNA